MKIETLEKRRTEIYAQMKDESIAIILSGEPQVRTADQFYDFVVWRNFFYLTNIDRAKCAFIMIKSETGMRQMLFIDEVTALEEKWTGVRMKKDEASRRSGIKESDIYGMPDFEKILGSIITRQDPNVVYFDMERYSYDHPDTHQMIFAKEFADRYPYITIYNLYPIIAKMRRIKSAEEIENIKTAIDKTRIGIEAMMKALKPGLYEYEIEAYYDFNAKLNGVEEKAFNTIVASGENATVLHYESNDSKMKKGDLILFDLGCAWHHYAADISRTFPVDGTFTPRQKEVYQAVLDVEKAVIEKVKPGASMSELNELAKDLLTEKCRQLKLAINNDDDVLNYYYHSIGHGLGLDTHDVGKYDDTLLAGMVITIEPGLYIAEEAIGVRIEDDILVTPTGYVNLSENIIKEIDEIEAFMNR